MGRRRADVALVEAGLFKSRAMACAAIEAGLVLADGMVVAKPASPVANGAMLEASPAHPWVSRGGVKLAAGLDAFSIGPKGKLCLDVGASTGGFTEVLLSRGARHVHAVDVGRDQFHVVLRSDPRVTLLEQTDIRALNRDNVPHRFDLVTVDVSFISLKLVLPTIGHLAAVRADLIALIKPEFEAGRAAVKKGVVRDPAIHRAVCDDIARFVVGLGWTLDGILPSPITGGDGNREFLLGARREPG